MAGGGHAVEIVLDASAVLAWLLREPAGSKVRPALGDAFIAAPNWAEVLQKTKQRGLDAAAIGARILGFGLLVTHVDRDDAEQAAAIWDNSHPLALADRFCIALGRRLDLPVWTCDRAWKGVDERVVVLR